MEEKCIFVLCGYLSPKGRGGVGIFLNMGIN
jgi:hypothetical protein